MRWICLFAVGIVACESPTAPLPVGAEPFEAPAVYARWWEITKECSGLSGDLSSIRWYVVPGVMDIAYKDGSRVAGWYDSRSHRIVVAGEQQLFGDVIRHEMLHALLRVRGHPRGMFIQRCGGVVVCVDKCISDGGPAPPPDPHAIRAAPTALRIEVSVDPAAPGSSQDDGHFRMVITARNPTASALDVQLPPSGDAGPPGSFGYRIRNGSGSFQYDMRADVPEVTRFAPGEVKRFIFDMRNRPGPYRYDLAPGTWTFAGRFGDAWATNPPTVVVAQ